jgi:hypothetical protein
MADALVGLSEALEALRAELEDSWRKGRGSLVRFGVSEVTLTVQAVTGREKDGSLKLRWWLIEAGGGGKSTAETTQTLTLSLAPTLNEPGKESAPLIVAGEQPGGPGG